ncbi:MAG: alanine racemase [Dehalococcoidia bacterium]|nr:alanine racemase [Dehalococcoidia bacterium]
MTNRFTIRPTRVEIDLNAIAHNLQAIRRKITGRVKIMAVVKADGYGHGATEVAKVALQSGADCLGVAIPEEGVELRLSGIKAPILILGLTPPEKVQEVVKYNLGQTLSTPELAEALSIEAQKLGEIAKVHIKVDTGMSRIGVSPKNAVNFVKQILTLKAIEIEGIFTHFSVSDSVDDNNDKSFTESQIGKFKQVVARLEENGIQIPIQHAANSAGVLNFPSSYFDMVRPGIIIYGLYYSRGVAVAENLEPAMSFKTAIIYLKTVAPEASISYGRTFTTEKESIIATLPVGYADGYNRLLSNKREVLIKGRRAPIVGRVCMDMTMIDVSHIPEVKIGDEVVLFGKQGDAEIPMDEIADKTNTIVNEVACSIGKRVPRVYLR